MTTKWYDYTDLHPTHTVAGKLRVLKDFYSPQLNNKRDLLVYLPPSHGRSAAGGTPKRFPVIYMHDGQNLFDAHTSFTGEWQVDETMQALSREGIEAIVVGLPNAGADRIHEYSPFADRMSAGRGAAYLRFIVETVKPCIDADFLTLPDRANTGLLGSSMGGLISLYGFLAHPQVFGFAGVVSPALWFGGFAIYDFVRSAAFNDGRLYLDVGTRELAGSHFRRGRIASVRYLYSVRRMRGLLEAKGYRRGEKLLYVEDRGGIHNERDWARRLPATVRFLLQPR